MLRSEESQQYGGLLALSPSRSLEECSRRPQAAAGGGVSSASARRLSAHDLCGALCLIQPERSVGKIVIHPTSKLRTY